MDLSGRVTINGSFLGKSPTGVQRYAWEITRRLLDTDLEPTLVLPMTMQPASDYRVPSHQQIRFYGKGSSPIWDQRHLPRLVGRNDLLWTPAGLAALRVRQQLYTLHDLSVLEHSEWFSPKYTRFYRLFLPVAIRRAQHILTSSQFTRHRLMAHFNLPEERITVVPGAVDDSISTSGLSNAEPEQLAAHYHLPARYLLAVSSLEPRKNLRRLLEASALVHQEYPDLKVVIVGEHRSIYQFVDMSGFPQEMLCLLGYVPTAHLRAIYSRALMFVYPSLYEGFGIPPLEAMACGVPVITSNVTAIPEVVGEAALQVDPLDVTALACAISSLVRDEALRQHLIAAGEKRVQQFRWDDSAARVQALLRTLIMNERR